MFEMFLALTGIILMGIGIGTIGAWVANRNEPDEHADVEKAGMMRDELGLREKKS